MILQYSIVEFLQQLRRLIRIQLIDVLRKWTNGVNALPSRDWIRPHNRMDSSELPPDVLWAASRVGVYADFVWVVLRGVQEA